MWLTLLFVLLSSVAGLQAQDDEGRFAVAGLKEREVEVFFTAFKEAVEKYDKQKVAAMLSYPITLYPGSGRKVKVASRARFIKLYDRIFDAEFKQLIANTEFKDLWARWSGVATPRGEIWINGIVTHPKVSDKYIIKITSINGPIYR